MGGSVKEKKLYKRYANHVMFVQYQTTATSFLTSKTPIVNKFVSFMENKGKIEVKILSVFVLLEKNDRE